MCHTFKKVFVSILSLIFKLLFEYSLLFIVSFKICFWSVIKVPSIKISLDINNCKNILDFKLQNYYIRFSPSSIHFVLDVINFPFKFSFQIFINSSVFVFI